MSSGSTLPPVVLGMDISWLLILGSALFLIGSAWLIYRRFAAPTRPPWRAIWTQYWPVMFSFATLAVVAALLGVASYFEVNSNGLRAAGVVGVFTSLLNDLIFFSLLGFMLILIQRREADRGRNIDDKIDLLFDAKRLRSGEVAYLKDQVRKVSADCRSNLTEIDVIQHDSKHQLIQMDVRRRFQVANYLATEAAEYKFQLDLTPDDACGNQPCAVVYPSITTSLLPDGRGGFESTEDEVLSEGAKLDAGEPYKTPSKLLQIEPGQMREFRTRFRAWQRLFKQAEAIAETQDSRKPEPDSFEILAVKHWDEILIQVRNSLPTKLCVTISGRESRSFELHPGDQQHKAYRVENLAANSTIYVSFEVL